MVQVKGSDIIFYFVVFYGLHTIQDRAQLWSDLTLLVLNMQMAILCMRDFNTMINGNDRLNESLY